MIVRKVGKSVRQRSRRSIRDLHSDFWTFRLTVFRTFGIPVSCLGLLTLLLRINSVLSLERFPVFFDILRGVHAKQFVELLAEKFSVINTYLESYLVYIEACIDKQFGSLSQPDKTHKPF